MFATVPLHLFVGSLMTLKLRGECSTPLIGLFSVFFFPSWRLINEIKTLDAILSLPERICCAAMCLALCQALGSSEDLGCESEQGGG